MSPIKEPCFFAPEVIDFTPESRQAYESDREALRTYLEGDTAVRRSHGIVVDWNDYLKLFKRVAGETAIGEVSGNYLASAGAADAIRARIPGARIVIMLRDPVDRLYSQYATVERRDTRRRISCAGHWPTRSWRVHASRHSDRCGPVSMASTFVAGSTRFRANRSRSTSTMTTRGTRRRPCGHCSIFSMWKAPKRSIHDNGTTSLMSRVSRDSIGSSDEILVAGSPGCCRNAGANACADIP